MGANLFLRVRRGAVSDDFDIMRRRHHAGKKSMEQKFFHNAVCSLRAVHGRAFRRPCDLHRSEHDNGGKNHRLLSISDAVDTDADVHGVLVAHLR